MKTTIAIIALLLSLAAADACAKNLKFWVRGECSMCKTRIEKTVGNIPGTSGAQWDQKTKMLTVSIDEKKTNQASIEKAVAKAGHATASVKADQKAYDALPDCCKIKK
jgi:periplasmic mercuric ion binding protein